LSVLKEPLVWTDLSFRTDGFDYCEFWSISDTDSSRQTRWADVNANQSSMTLFSQDQNISHQPLTMAVNLGTQLPRVWWPFRSVVMKLHINSPAGNPRRALWLPYQLLFDYRQWSGCALDAGGTTMNLKR